MLVCTHVLFGKQVVVDSTEILLQALRVGYRCGLDDFGLLKEIGGLYAKQGKYSSAIPVLQRAIASASGVPVEVHATLGDALTEIGDLEAAKRQWALVQLSCESDTQLRSIATAALDGLNRTLGGG